MAFYLSNYKFSQLIPSPLNTGDKLWVIKEQSTNLTPVSSRVFPMVEVIKKREENQRMLRGLCCLLRHGRTIQGKHPSRSHSSLGAGGNPKASLPALCAASVNLLLFYSSPLKSKEYLLLAIKGSAPIRALHHARAGGPISPGSSRNQFWGAISQPSQTGQDAQTLLHSGSLFSLSLTHTQIK